MKKMTLKQFKYNVIVSEMILVSLFILIILSILSFYI